MQALRLRSVCIEAAVLPEAGGGLAAFDWIASQRRVALMRPLAEGVERPPPNLLACYPLVPWSNRIGHGRFEFGGKRFHIAPNHPQEPYPIHGEGWLRPWEIRARDDRHIALRLDRRDGAPFAYTAQLTYTVDHDALAMELAVEHHGSQTMPYGLGLHPWFERTPGVRLHAPARGMWLSGPDVLPIAHGAPPGDADFRSPGPLPGRLLDNCFTGWDGVATITWEDRSIALQIESSPPLEYYVCYCPVGKPLFCFEPVTHPIDAFNLPPPYTCTGLKPLAAGERTSIRVTMRAQPLA